VSDIVDIAVKQTADRMATTDCVCVCETLHDAVIRYDTIYYLHWKTDRQAASL